MQTKPKDPDAMEINNTRLNLLSDEKWKQLMKEGKCFRCRRQGHMSNTCPNKQSNYPPKTRVSEIINDHDDKSETGSEWSSTWSTTSMRSASSGRSTQVNNVKMGSDEIIRAPEGRTKEERGMSLTKSCSKERIFRKLEPDGLGKRNRQRLHVHIQEKSYTRTIFPHSTIKNGWNRKGTSLISSLIEKLHGRTLFTKFDIRWARSVAEAKISQSRKNVIKDQIKFVKLWKYLRTWATLIAKGYSRALSISSPCSHEIQLAMFVASFVAISIASQILHERGLDMLSALE